MGTARHHQLERLARAIRRNLIPWFGREARDLPWRRRRTPYKVWVSELMLQQTRADQVVPYFRKWMRRFPSLRALAAASQQEVLKVWEGLGYYARARRLHATARYLVAEKGGRFPNTYTDLLELPGVGPYTAAAIASLAFDEDHAVVDGNVMRVLTRLMAYGGNIANTTARRNLQVWAQQLLPPGNAGVFNEAVMELGATVCLPRNPLCTACPLKGVCLGHEQGRAEWFPRKTRKKPVPHKKVGAAVTRRKDGRILIAQRREESMLGGLWEFPGGTLEDGETMKACIARELKEEMGITIEVGKHLVTVEHAYSHFTMELHVHWARLLRGRPRTLECADFAWVRPSELKGYPFSRADQDVVKLLEAAD